MRLPLSSGWKLRSHALHAQASATLDTFILPGADALAGFADLIGGAEDGTDERLPDAPGESAAENDIPFSIPGTLPPQAEGSAVLSREIDFGALAGDHATLSLGLLAGRGEAYLNGERIGSFSDGSLTLDVTNALSLARTQTLELRFDGTRPAGLFGPATLCVSRFARLKQLDILPNAQERTMTVCARIRASRSGEYDLHASFIPSRPADAAQEFPSVRETSFSLRAGEERTIELSMDAPAQVFSSGQPYDAPAMRVRLWLRTGDGLTGRSSTRSASAETAEQRDTLPGALCDEELLLCGYPGSAPRFWLPLSREDAVALPDELVAALRVMGISAVSFAIDGSGTTQAFPPEPLLLALTRAGIGARIEIQNDMDADADRAVRARLSRFPCVTFARPHDDSALTDGESARDARLLAPHALCGMIAYPRTPADDLAPAALLDEAAGRSVDPDVPETVAVLSWLRAVLIRLRAEAMRQGVLSGALCRPGEWREADVADALRTALAPTHLSALPLYGAWWTCSRFSAALHAFVAEEETGLCAYASLENEGGDVLAQAIFPCPPHGGRLGLLEATLPDTPCVLTLHTRIMRGETLLEESALPVYVGERGPLQSAF